MHEVQYWSENCCYARNSIAQRIKIFSISTARSNLDIFRLFLKHWIRLIQSYNYVFQSMWDSQRAEIDSSGKRVTTRWVVTQRNESLQSRLLDQTSMFFNYFWSIELSLIRATIMSFKVCWVVSAHMLIRAKKEILLGEQINQRSESSQSHLLDQILIFFDYFWSIEFSSIRATIMSFKVCQVVNAHRLIRARKDAKRWKNRSKLRSNIFNLIY